MSSYKKSFDMFPQKQQQKKQQQLQQQQQISNGKISRCDTLGEYQFNIFILFFLPFFLSFFLTFFFFDFNISFVKFHRKEDGRISQYGSIRNFL